MRQLASSKFSEPASLGSLASMDDKWLAPREAKISRICHKNVGALTTILCTTLKKTSILSICSFIVNWSIWFILNTSIRNTIFILSSLIRLVGFAAPTNCMLPNKLERKFLNLLSDSLLFYLTACTAPNVTCFSQLIKICIAKLNCIKCGQKYLECESIY